jgi:hypothetical protein
VIDRLLRFQLESIRRPTDAPRPKVVHRVDVVNAGRQRGYETLRLMLGRSAAEVHGRSVDGDQQHVRGMTVVVAVVTRSVAAARPGLATGPRFHKLYSTSAFRSPAHIESDCSGGDSGRALYVLGEIGELIESGRFSLPVALTFPLAAVAEAHRLSEQGGVRGKLVLLVR